MNVSKFKLFASDISFNTTINVSEDIAGANGLSSKLITDVKVADGEFTYLKCPAGMNYVAMGTPFGNVLLTLYKPYATGEGFVRLYCPEQIKHHFKTDRDLSDKEFEDQIFAYDNLGKRLSKALAQVK